MTAPSSPVITLGAGASIPGPSLQAAIAAIADGARVAMADDALAAIAAGHACLLRRIAAGDAIYGVSTGLGAAVDTRMTPGDAAFQTRVILARATGVGAEATIRQVRAIMAARLVGFAHGHSGISTDAARGFMALLNHDVTPVVPLAGSISEGDLAPLAHVACVLAGEGAADTPQGRLAGRVALAAAGLAPPDFGPKDGLALVSSNAPTIGLASLAVADLRRVFIAHVGGFALSCEGFGANLSPFAPEAAMVRPAPGQADIAGRVMRLLAGGGLCVPGAARRLQDPISLRSFASVAGAALHYLEAAESALEGALGASDDNPAVLAREDRLLPNGNFDPTHLALAFDVLRLACARLAAMGGERIAKLMSPAVSGLPRFLPWPGDEASGFGPLQKTVSALVAAIGHDAMPLPFLVMPVADRIEDYASLAMEGVRNAALLIGRLRSLTAIECLVARRAVALRGESVLGAGTRAMADWLDTLIADAARPGMVSTDITAIDHAIAAGATPLEGTRS